jgi:hypothetical protein
MQIRWLATVTLLLCALPGLAEERPRALVVDMKGSGLGEGELDILQQIVTESIARLEQFEVASSDDLRAMMDVEAEKTLTDCDEGDSCFAEIASALGARFIVSSTAGRLGDLTVVTLNIVDTQDATASRRKRVEAKDVADLPRKMDRAFAEMLGLDTGPSGFAISTGAVAGVASVAALGFGLYTLSLDGALGDPTSTPDTKETAINQGPAMAFIAIGATSVAVVAGGITAAALVLE